MIQDLGDITEQQSNTDKNMQYQMMHGIVFHVIDKYLPYYRYLPVSNLCQFLYGLHK